MKIITIISIALSSFFLGGCAFGQKSPKNDINTIVQLVESDSAIIVDVRTPEEFGDGHILNAINIPVDVIADSLQFLKDYENIVVVCRSGKRAGKAASILNDNGFQNVYNGKAWDSLDKSLNK